MAVGTRRWKRNERHDGVGQVLLLCREIMPDISKQVRWLRLHCYPSDSINLDLSPINSSTPPSQTPQYRPTTHLASRARRNDHPIRKISANQAHFLLCENPTGLAYALMLPIKPQIPSGRRPCPWNRRQLLREPTESKWLVVGDTPFGVLMCADHAWCEKLSIKWRLEEWVEQWGMMRNVRWFEYLTIWP